MHANYFPVQMTDIRNERVNEISFSDRKGVKIIDFTFVD
jgi:hypothetical protein